ncbi:hypothetical protein JCM10450v2_001470 [Rhodotorula kratochvilovae]
MASFDPESLRPDIERILSTADRSSVSAKAVRKALQAQYPDLDVRAHKEAIDGLTTELFTAGGDDDDEAVEEHQPASPPETKPKLPSFHKLKRERSPSSSAALGEPSSSPAFPLATTSAKKKPEEDDEAMARRLQAEFAAQTGGRTTRNGTSTGSSTKKRAAGAKKKSKARVSDDDDSDDGAAKKKKKRKTSHTGFNKLHLLSPEMAEVCGEQVASRPRVTKLMWRYIKAHDLQDPNKKTEILPDETLSRVLPFARINSFTMAKHISPHLFEFDPEQHNHLIPPPSDDEGDSGSDEKKPKLARAPKADKAGVRGSGRGLSKEEVDSEDELSD